ncbi:MAG: RBBP9/YdeN family alpha/beta hydrolase [Micrococcales bacterium]
MARIFLHHGLGNLRPVEHWQHRTAIALRKLGHQVAYPQFPSPDSPDIAKWQQLLVAEIEQLVELGDEAGELIYIGHSLGALSFFQAVKDGVLPGNFDRTLLVAPADPELLPDLPVGQLATGLSAIRGAVFESAGQLTIVASDSDQWLPRGVHATFGDPLDVTPIVIAGAKHFSALDGWGPWQGVIDWVLDPSADLTRR